MSGPALALLGDDLTDLRGELRGGDHVAEANLRITRSNQLGKLGSRAGDRGDARTPID